MIDNENKYWNIAMTFELFLQEFRATILRCQTRERERERLVKPNAFYLPDLGQ